jgi:hypothetical protein
MKLDGRSQLPSYVGHAVMPVLDIYNLLSQSRLPDILNKTPTAARIQGWKAKTQSEFDPLEDAGLRTTKWIMCPTCRRPVDAR